VKDAALDSRGVEALAGLPWVATTQDDLDVVLGSHVEDHGVPVGGVPERVAYGMVAA